MEHGISSAIRLHDKGSEPQFYCKIPLLLLFASQTRKNKVGGQREEKGKQNPKNEEEWNCEMRDQTSLSCVEKEVTWGWGEAVRGREREVLLCNITSKKSKLVCLALSQVSLSAASPAIPERTSVFSWLRFSSTPTLLLFLSGWEYWGKVQWPLSGNQLIFIRRGGEECVECIDVQTQTTALCVCVCVCSRSLICEGMNLQITESTARTTVQPRTCIM